VEKLQCIIILEMNVTNNNSANRHGSSNGPRGRNITKSESQSRAAKQTRPPKECRECGESGHVRRNCPRAQSSRGAGPRGPRRTAAVVAQVGEILAESAARADVARELASEVRELREVVQDESGPAGSRGVPKASPEPDPVDDRLENDLRKREMEEALRDVCPDGVVFRQYDFRPNHWVRVMICALILNLIWDQIYGAGFGDLVTLGKAIMVFCRQGLMVVLTCIGHPATKNIREFFFPDGDAYSDTFEFLFSGLVLLWQLRNTIFAVVFNHVFTHEWHRWSTQLMLRAEWRVVRDFEFEEARLSDVRSEHCATGKLKYKNPLYIKIAKYDMYSWFMFDISWLVNAIIDALGTRDTKIISLEIYMQICNVHTVTPPNEVSYDSHASYSQKTKNFSTVYEEPLDLTFSRITTTLKRINVVNADRILTLARSDPVIETLAIACGMAYTRFLLWHVDVKNRGPAFRLRQQ